VALGGVDDRSFLSWTRHRQKQMRRSISRPLVAAEVVAITLTGRRVFGCGLGGMRR